MELRRDLSLPIVVSIGVVLLTSFGAIALLTRMAPAIEQILEENVYSLEAVEDMLTTLAANEPETEAKATFERALGRARANITEDEERPPLATIRRDWPAAFEGDPEARAAVTRALLELGDINRGAMVRADEDARRLGLAGAWAIALLGFLAFAWGLLAAHRMRRRVVAPLSELTDVLRQYASGERYRRCHVMSGPVEIVRAMETVNELLDALATPRSSRTPASRDSSLDRRLLVYLLDQRREPAFVIDRDGTIAAANQEGLDLLGSDAAPRAREILDVCARGEPADGAQCDPVPDTPYLFCLISTAPTS